MRRLLKTFLPKTCDEFEADLVLYAYGKIASQESESIEAHLDSCAACRRRQDRLLEEVATAPLDFPPPQFWNDYSREMRQKLAAIDEKRRNRLKWSMPLGLRGITAVAATLVLVIALGITLKNTVFSSPEGAQEDAMMKVLPIVQNLEFFESMHYLEMMDPQVDGHIKSSDMRSEFGPYDSALSATRASGCISPENNECQPLDLARRISMASSSMASHAVPYSRIRSVSGESVNGLNA